MTVENQTYKVVAEGNGSGFSFSFSPMVLPTDEDDLEVTLTDADGADTTLTRGSGASNYSVSVSSFPGTGSITYPADSSTALPSGQYLTMKRVLVLEQTQDIENQGGYSPETLETTLDKLVMIALQQQEELDFSMKTSVQDTSAIGRLPNAATRASKYLFFDANGDPTAVSSISSSAVSSFAETILDDDNGAEVRTTIGAQEDVVTTRGDLVYGDSTPEAARLAVGTANQVLTTDGTDVSWGDVAVSAIADGTDGELITWDSSGVPTTVSAGTSGQVLTSNGAGAEPTFQATAAIGKTWSSSPITLAALSSTAETTSIPSGAIAIKVLINGVSPDANDSSLFVELSDSMTYPTSGHSVAEAFSTGTDAHSDSETNGPLMILGDAGGAESKDFDVNDAWSGQIDLWKDDENRWFMRGLMQFDGSEAMQLSTGLVTLAGECDRLKITCDNNIDAGEAVIWVCS